MVTLFPKKGVTGNGIPAKIIGNARIAQMHPGYQDLESYVRALFASQSGQVGGCLRWSCGSVVWILLPIDFGESTQHRRCFFEGSLSIASNTKGKSVMKAMKKAFAAECVAAPGLFC
jgi:hypothetical protein